MMAVFVDRLVIARAGMQDRISKAEPRCHLAADTVAELDEMAVRMGLKRNQYCSPSYHSSGNLLFPGHYELDPKRREVAIRLGAKSVSAEAFLALCGVAIDRVQPRNGRTNLGTIRLIEPSPDSRSDLAPALQNLLDRWNTLSASVQWTILALSSHEGPVQRH